ncbi:ATP-binding protein [Micromonospora sp. WMMD754]|uniref:ATP-binding protein n=1 Tax=Micromonospora sp. WMMD754 TaxID=3404114 RepID=UPI003BF54E66
MTSKQVGERFSFTVDTHLFRELGELLVGRESTALMELIKNAYDADATRVTVSGRGLRIKDEGRISIMDDGIGMTPDIFQGAFLRIAGRYKEQGDRRSPKFRRRYTGAKGVGRLSAHKLARRLEVVSTPSAVVRAVIEPGRPRRGVRALIDWEALEDDHETLEQAGEGLVVKPFIPGPSDIPGTTLVLSGLRRKWTPTALENFIAEVSSGYAPTELLSPPPAGVVRDGLLLGTITPWTRGSNDPGFRVVFDGDLDTGEALVAELMQRANWLIEIEASASGVTFAIEPTKAEARGLENLPHYRFYMDHPDPANGPFFLARIYAREGSVGSRASVLGRFARRTSGIRVYVEGFRTLPYGDQGDDWLSLDRDYARKPRSFDIDLDSGSGSSVGPVENEGFLTLGNDQYFGGVFLTADGAESLRPVVNREGFLQNAAFGHLRDIVRSGVDLLTRVRAARNAEDKKRRRAEMAADVAKTTESPTTHPRRDTPSSVHASVRRSEEPPPEPASSKKEDLAMSLAVVRDEVHDLRSAAGNPEVLPRVARIERALDLLEEASQYDEEEATLRLLAGVGLQLAAFVHEINGVLGLARSIRALTEAARSSTTGNRRLPALLRDVDAAADQLVQSLARLASYLVDVVGPDSRRRRRRIPLSDVADSSLAFVAGSARERQITIEIDMAEDVKTPPVFQAELTLVLTNLLTNAIKAAETGGRIAVSGRAALEGGVRIVVENTGIAVDLNDAERWFRPFESTTVSVDSVLGQGMGLGLPITRRVISEYGGTVRFVKAGKGFMTAVEVFIPGRRVRR